MTVSQSHRALLVLGMHRSGTSALTGALQLLGVSLGQNLLPEKDDNRAGFWEHAGVVAIHENLLAEFGVRWHDPTPLALGWQETEAAKTAIQQLTDLCRSEFENVPLWGVKDPRLCRLVPLWQTVLNTLGVRPGYLLMVRHPVEVALSLQKRDGFSLEKGLLLWLDHLLMSEYYSRGADRTWVFYDQLLAQPQDVFSTLAGDLDLALPALQDKDWDTYLKRDLRHHHQPEWPKGPLSQQVRELYESLSALTSVDFDSVRHLLVVAGNLFGPVLGWEQDRLVQQSQEIDASRESHKLRDAREAEQVAVIHRLEQVRDDLEAQVRDFETQLGSARAGVTDLEQQLVKAHAADVDMKAQLEAAKAGQSDLEIQLMRTASENKDLEQRINEARAALSAKDSEIDAARNRIDALVAEIDTARQRNQTLLDELDAAREQIQSVADELEAARVSSKLLETQLEAHKQTMVAKEDELARAAASGRELEAQVSAKLTEIDGARQNMRDLEGQITVARANLENLAASEQSLQALAAQRLAELEALRWRRLLGRLLGVKSST